MNKELKYNGHTASPSDYECPDGDLSVLLDMWPENGVLKPVLKPGEVMTLSANLKVVYLHETSSYKHYIILNTTGVSKILFYRNASSQSNVQIAYLGSDDLEIYSYSSIGNTLLVLTPSGIHYFLWDIATQNYLDLGFGLPECPMSFGIKKEAFYESSQFTATLAHGIYIYNTSAANSIFNFNKFYGNQTDSDVTNASRAEENSNAVTETILAKVNKFIADEGTNKGRFVFPFFVRYALRLYDGSLTHLSAPILMIPATGVVPQVDCFNSYSSELQTDLNLKVRGCTFSLNYAIKSAAVKTQLQLYKDLITSVDIFISAPIYKYKQGGVCPGMALSNVCGDSICDQTYNSYAKEPYFYGNSFSGNATCLVKLPQYTDEEVKEDVTSRANFYLLKSIPIAELQTNRTKIEIANDYLQSLTNREVLKDGYQEHDLLIPKFAMDYNSRLNIGNLSRLLFKGFGPEQFAFNNSSDEQGRAPENMKCYVFIREGNNEIIVESDEFPVGQDCASCYYFFYPNTKAYKAIVGCSGYWKQIDLKVHPTLNGAYYFGNWGSPLLGNNATTVQNAPTPSSGEGLLVSVPNKLYTSDVNNPFYFPVANINTLGTGQLLGISTAAKALSQGQFGQFPLYAFTTDGVWALEVSSTTGAFSAKQPITRDVCLNAESITQLDNAVLFVTERGIMFISGSETMCVSEAIDNKNDAVFSTLPQMSQIMLGGQSLTFVSFKTFLSGARIIYDYTSQRVIVFNPSYSYAYIYSRQMKLWAMMRSNIVSAVKSYPEALAMTSDNKLIDFSQRVANTTSSGASSITQLLVTRPLKLDLSDELKTIDNIIQRGNFVRGHVQTLLWGSRDLQNWFPVFSSTDHYLRGFRGTPYKYFRIGLKCNLLDSENLAGCSVQFDVKENNQPR